MTDTEIVPTEQSGAEIEPAPRDLPPAAVVHPHPQPRQYVLIAVVLSVLTAIEIGMFYLEGDVNDNVLIALLAVLATTKFFLVAAWYMHMKVDAPFFRRMFVVGLGGAVVVYGITLLTFASTTLAD